MEPVPSLPSGLPQIIILLVVLAVVWVVIRFVFRLATRVMTLGCLAILVLGAILVASRYLVR